MVVKRKKVFMHPEKKIFENNVEDILDDILGHATKRIKRVVRGK